MNKYTLKFKNTLSKNLDLYNALNKTLPSPIEHLQKLIPNPQYKKHILLIDNQEEAWYHGWGSRIEQNTEFPYNQLQLMKQHLAKYNDITLLNVVKLFNHKSLNNSLQSQSQLQFIVVPHMKIYTIEKNDIEEFVDFVMRDTTERKPLTFEDYLQGRAVEAVGGGETKTETSHVVSAEGKQFRGEEISGDIFLACGHNERDCRCGAVAPGLVEEYMKIAADECVQHKKNMKFKKGVVGIVSHVGGHKFAGNVIFYVGGDQRKSASRESVDGLWFGKVLPPMVRGVVEDARAKVLDEELFRGGVSLVCRTG